jgi:hypothetical protein
MTDFPWPSSTSVRLKLDLCWIESSGLLGISVLINGSRTAQRSQAMLTNSKIALSLVFVLIVSAAVAAPKQSGK